ncbi:uncharacterized protein LOC129583474 [Paramacrobiotus metropolitanus]|uniref:uncharacterized protein LOC129583474 n=1 Tax=Paramacrobiotus metropolitanus TaxID=2943436 RepID=UPI0024463E50|nr:uncharacterized protein LOC129583474 [Paramacrobiotus metropolitanus]
MSVVSRNPSISVQNMNKTTSSVGHIWSETSTKSSKIDHPASTSKSPYIREIHTNAARRVERQQQQHLRSRPSLPSSHLSSTLPKGRAVPRTRASGSLSSGFIPGTFSNGASSISALSITGTVEHDELDLGYQGHLSDRTSARRTDVFTVCDVEIQVRSKVTDKSVQADDMADESVLSTVQKENEEIMEENFKLRRLVEDLR